MPKTESGKQLIGVQPFAGIAKRRPLKSGNWILILSKESFRESLISKMSVIELKKDVFPYFKQY